MLMIAGCMGDVFACVVMLFAWRQAPRHRRAPGRRLWLFQALLFAALAVEKALHLDERVDNAMRVFANMNDSYGARRELQVAILVLAVIGLVLIVRGWQNRRRLPAAMRRIRWLGLMLLGLDAIRAVSLHQIDEILFASVGRLHVNHLLEGGLTALILLNTVSCLRAWREMARNSIRST